MPKWPTEIYASENLLIRNSSIAAAVKLSWRESPNCKIHTLALVIVSTHQMQECPELCLNGKMWSLRATESLDFKRCVCVFSCFLLPFWYICIYIMYLTNLRVYNIIHAYTVVVAYWHHITLFLFDDFAFHGPMSPTWPPSKRRPGSPARLRSNDGRRLRHPCFNGADGPSTNTEAEAKIGILA